MSSKRSKRSKISKSSVNSVSSKSSSETIIGSEALEPKLKMNFPVIGGLIVLHQLCGFFWYSEKLFLNPWLDALGKTLKNINASNPIPFIYAILTATFLNFFLSWIFVKLNIRNGYEGVKISLLIWMSCLFFPMATHSAFAGTNPGLILIDGGKEALVFFFSGLILGTFFKTEKSPQSNSG